MTGQGVLPVDPGATEGLLTPTQRAVWELLKRPEGICRRTAAMADVFELANRISEIEDRLGIKLERDRCRLHDHRHHLTRYRIAKADRQNVDKDCG